MWHSSIGRRQSGDLRQHVKNLLQRKVLTAENVSLARLGLFHRQQVPARDLFHVCQIKAGIHVSRKIAVEKIHDNPSSRSGFDVALADRRCWVYYNHRRPHKSLPGRATPAATYAARPKAAPGDRAADTHDRVRTDRIDTTGVVTLRHGGKLYHIGTGRAWAATRVLLLVQDLHIRVINADTGELLRELTLDPARNYQPTGRPPGPKPRTP